jgi:TRAP-type mannitol/chloroaromatic compound transport system permease small subunit
VSVHATRLGAAVVALAATLDRITRAVGDAVCWLTLLIPLVCFGYAVVRKLARWGHNGFSELQWYLFATVYLLAAGYTLLRDQHVRVDVFWRVFRPATRCAIDIALLLPLLVVCLFLANAYWDFWLVSAAQREGPEDVLTGLERWPIKLALFVGFGLLAMQCASELLKRWAVLRGWLAAAVVYPPEGAGWLPAARAAPGRRPWMS